jgi:hypothetical protein
MAWGEPAQPVSLRTTQPEHEERAILPEVPAGDAFFNFDEAIPKRADGEHWSLSCCGRPTALQTRGRDVDDWTEGRPAARASYRPRVAEWLGW